MKIALFLLVLLTACSDPKAKNMEQDVKRGFDKAKNSPATKELTDDVKRGFNKADAAVTKSLEKGREKIREKVK